MDKEYIAVELTDEELAKVVGGIKTPDGTTRGGMIYNLDCGTCTLASEQYLTCPRRNSNSSDCKYVQ